MTTVDWNSLDVPHTYLYSGKLSTSGERINRFALSLKSVANRREFLANSGEYLSGYSLNASETKMIELRDWCGLLSAGGHLQAVLKIAATVGESLWHIGARCTQMSVEEIKAACPRRVTGLPRGFG